MARKKTTAEFIEQAKTVHGDKYDYSLVDYVNSNIKVNIICNEHGEFNKTAKDLLRSHGCPKCGQEQSITKRRKLQTDQNIKKEN